MRVVREVQIGEIFRILQSDEVLWWKENERYGECKVHYIERK